MARFRVVSPHQVSGWRFLYRRIEHALVRRDASMIDDPGRGRSTALVIGIAMACVVVAGAAVLAFFKPAKVVGTAKIVVDKDSGALYVNLQNRLYPALNLTSARLIVGSPDNPVQVSGDELSKHPRGPWVGIPGAPGRMIGSASRDSSWAVCDTTRTGAAAPLDSATGLPTASAQPVRSTAIGGPLTVDGMDVREIGDTEARLVRVDTTNWLIYRTPAGRVVKAQLRMGDTAVLLALGIDPASRPAPATRQFITAIPEAPALTVPKIPGSSTSADISGMATRIGSVLSLASPDRPAAYYVVVQGGLVQVSPVLAAMLRNADPQGAPVTRTVAPNVIASNLRSQMWAGTETFPNRPVQLIQDDIAPTVCYAWARSGGDQNARISLIVGRQLPLRSEQQGDVVALVTASASRGTTADAVYLPPTTGRFVESTGGESSSPRMESLWWISDSGVRYGIETVPAQGGSDPTLQALGIGAPVPAPWSIVSLFAPGPTLSQRDARVQHDGIPPDKYVAELPKTPS